MNCLPSQLMRRDTRRRQAEARKGRKGRESRRQKERGRGTVTVDRFLKNPCARARVPGVSVVHYQLPMQYGL